jgi:hypothetical protein
MKNSEIIQHYLDGTRPYAKVGYTGDKDKYIIRKTGERWTDSSGKEWEQKESGPQTVTRVMDIIRAEMNEKCTCCKREIRWGSKHDRKMYFKTKKCFDCLIEEETQLRVKGKFKLYETKKLLENELSYLNDIKQKLKESKEYLASEGSKKLTYVNSNGFVEEWDNNVRAELAISVEKDLKTCLKKIKEGEKELKKINNEIDSVLTTS